MEIANVNVFVAFAAGVVSVLSPCVLPLVPVYLAYLTGSTVRDMEDGNGRGTAIKHSLAFTAGFGLVLVGFGVSVGLVGYVLRDNIDVLSKAAGVLMIVFGLHLARVFRIPLLEREYGFQVGQSGRAGYLRSFMVGAAYSVGWSPCVGPTLGAILTLAAASGSVAQGGVLLAVYAVGFGVPFIAASFAMSGVRHLMQWLGPRLSAVEMVSGTVLVAVGVLVFQGALIDLNRYFSGFTPTVSF